MITEDYVSFETAKLLKEKGFDEPCFTNKQLFPGQILRPTQQMAMRWLREIHKISIEIGSEGYLVDNDVIWECDIKAGHKLYFRHIIGKSFESVVEEAIKYCLEKLIP